MTATTLLRPRDSDALRAEIRWVAEKAGVPVVFGGEVFQDTLLISELHGTTTNGLRGLPVVRAYGLGGRVIDTKRPAVVSDYRSASTITHDYDGPVAGEGIRSVAAIPVVVGECSRAVLYAATRGGFTLGDRITDLILQAGRRLAAEIHIRDEVDRRVRLLELTAPSPDTAPAVAEELRAIHADLRGMACSTADDELRIRLHDICARLGRTLVGEPSPDAPALSRRELDVLAQIALGCTNHEAAQRLSIGPETVKSYLRNSMVKLGARTRHEAVALARRYGLLP
ncbi:LuxR family transcriptional regulator [Nocardia panacis]|uniref:LuxR family transcriptional regulator n=1 Tax=Nocardia panacis TaxID=2340916 RepID=A0A3A4KZE3_9NOCA|nr:helix-turn-helix transcriptional regulator [Nocardia panacis]RJO74887.1 LuxR family transcriptional regulator [Nocardia panacis]